MANQYNYQPYYNSLPPKPSKSGKVLLGIIFTIVAIGFLYSYSQMAIHLANNNELIRSWDQIILDNRGEKVQAVAFSPDGKTLAVANKQGTVKLWEIVSGTELATLKDYQGELKAITFSPDGKTLAGGGEKGIMLWEVSSGKMLITFPGSDSGKPVNSLVYSPDGQKIAAGNKDGTIRVWDSTTRQKLVTFYDKLYSSYDSVGTDPNTVNAIAFGPDSDTIASAGNFHSVKVWKISRGKMQLNLSGGSYSDDIPVNAIAISPDGNTLAVGFDSYSQNNIQQWSLPDGKPGINPMVKRTSTLAFSSDGKFLAAGGENFISLLSPDSGKELFSFSEPYREAPPPHFVWDTTIAISPDGKTLATGNTDGVLRLWKLKPPK